MKKKSKKKKFVWLILTTDEVYGTIGMNHLPPDSIAFDTNNKAKLVLKSHYHPGHYYVKKVEVK